MKGTGKKFLIVVMIGLFLFGIGQVVGAEKWQPYQFKGNEYFEYKILLEEDEEKEQPFIFWISKKVVKNLRALRRSLKLLILPKEPWPKMN